MAHPFLKNIERRGKKLVEWGARLFARKASPDFPAVTDLNKILLLRLDEKIGNSLMMWPLVCAIRKNRPRAEIHLWACSPVTHLFQAVFEDNRIVYHHYDQDYFWRHPQQFFARLKYLRQQKIDLAISCHNPDNFSLSQALLARWIRPGCLLGFRWKDSAAFYDVAVPSGTDRHYVESLLDLWRYFVPEAKFDMECNPGMVRLPPADGKEELDSETGRIIFWIGATPGKELNSRLIAFIYEQLVENLPFAVELAAGPADRALVERYPQWIRQQVSFQRGSLSDTARYFASGALFVSGDTGPMHLAALLNIPTLTIFTRTNARQYGYQDGARHFALQWKDTAENRMELNKIILKLKALYHG